MYPHFIEVHDIRKPEDAMLINIKAIKHIYFEPATNSGAISLVDKVFVPTKESYDEMKQLIKDAGCSINRSDPRLDTAHPLTMEDLRGMIGEPVWTPSGNCWCLVHDDGSEEYDYKLVNRHGIIIGYSEEDLIKYPLYRMKQ